MNSKESVDSVDGGRTDRCANIEFKACLSVDPSLGMITSSPTKSETRTDLFRARG